MKPEMKKLIIANLPYLLFVYLFGKLGQAYRLAEGIDLSQKLLHFADGCAAAFANAAPSFNPFDLLIGVAGAVALRLMVYCKGKNAKKYRKGVEYGSARWGGPKDIAPYIDPNFDNNIFLVTYGRMIEIYAVTALGPIPLATLGNAEWRGMGQNYLKSLLALGFQAFLIMVVVGIYAVLIQQIGTADDISGAIWGCMGYTVLLCFCLFKTGSISKAVFTAH